MVPPAASAAYRRRILLDIGAREFESSVAWFLHAYPGPAFDDIYAFEMLPHTFAVPAAPALRHRFGDRARPFETNRFHFQVRAVLRRRTYHAIISSEYEYSELMHFSAWRAFFTMHHHCPSSLIF